MTGIPRRVALVSMHTSPAEQAGAKDAGGMNVVLRETATALAARGVEVDLLTRATGSAATRELEPGVTLHELRAGPVGTIPKTELAAVSDEFGEGVAALAGRTSEHYDLIHAHYWLSGVATLPVALELGIPFVQSFHTLAAMKDRLAAPGTPPEPARRRKSESYLASQANAIVAGSAAEATSLVDEVHAAAQKVWVIPPGVDVELFRPDRADADARIRRELSIPPGRPILAVVGRIQALKDQELAVRTLARLETTTANSPVLVIAGEVTPGDEPYLHFLQELAAQLHVEKSVRFVGALSRERLAELFAIASLTLLPSRSETFGLVALESASSGTPVIGFRGSGMLESIAEGRSGSLVATREPGEWAMVVAALLGDARRLEQLSHSARDHALDFTWAASATALLAVYASRYA